MYSHKLLTLILSISIIYAMNSFCSLAASEATLRTTKPTTNNTTAYALSKKQCGGCDNESLQFLYAHNIVRATQGEPALAWSSELEGYARWWAGQRRADCALVHSFPEGEFRLGENIFWGGGSGWTPYDAVKDWADERRYYSYVANSCEGGHECGHYTQIVWRSTTSLGCARAVCYNGDVFMTCNYYPPGNYIGERPY